MAYNDNKDILSWKRLIDAIQTNDKLRVVKESLKEGGVHELRVDQQTHITAEHHDVVVSSNDMGIIVDIYDKKSDNIDTNTYWNDDVMEGKEEVTEGTWSVPETPEQVEKLTNLLKNPLNAEKALDELYDVFGDDELFDDLEVMKRNEPETDVRHVVIRRLKDMNFIKEVRENAKPTKESLASTTDDLSALEDIVMSYWDRLDDDMKAELKKFWDEPRDTDEVRENAKPTNESRKVSVTDIQWDADDMEDIKQALKVGDLKRNMIVPIPDNLDDEEVDEFISDYITNHTGFTHKGFVTDPEIGESWTIPDSELASKDWGDAEKHKRTYKVIHATKGTMEVEATTSYEAAKLFAKAKGLKSTKGVDAYLADAEHVAEDSEDGASAEDLVDIITHRIKQDNNLMLKLLGDEGPDSLMNAIENVADFYSGTTEVGSSDVSAMVDAVKKQLI